MISLVDLKHTLESARTIAIMGCSADPSRTSYRIADYLQQAGYRIIPVNPNYEEVLGERCYPDLHAVPADIHIDIVNIFRRARFTAEMVQQAIDRAEETGERPTIWTQLAVHSPLAENLAEAAGFPYVKNRCIMVAHRQMAGMVGGG